MAKDNKKELKQQVVMMFSIGGIANSNTHHDSGQAGVESRICDVIIDLRGLLLFKPLTHTHIIMSVITYGKIRKYRFQLQPYDMRIIVNYHKF